MELTERNLEYKKEIFDIVKNQYKVYEVKTNA